MAVETYGENDRHRQQHREDQFFTESDGQQASDVGGEDHHLRRHDVDHNRADEETFFTLEQRPTRGAMPPYPEAGLEDGRAPAGGTAEEQAAGQQADDRWATFSHKFSL